MKSHCPYKVPIVFEKKLEMSRNLLESALDVGLVKNPNDNASRAAEQQLEAASFAIQCGSTDTLLDYFSIANELGKAHIQLAINPDRPVEFCVANKTYIGLGAVSTYNMHFDFWLKLFSTAIIVRDRYAIDLLCKVEVSDLSSSELGSDPLDDALLVMIQGMFNNKADIKGLVRGVMEKSDPSYLTPERQSYAYYVLLPFANVLVTVMSKDSESKFRTGIHKALELHQKYWSKKELERTPSGWISLPLIAAAILGKTKRNYSIDFESDYLPLSLLGY